MGSLVGYMFIKFSMNQRGQTRDGDRFKVYNGHASGFPVRRGRFLSDVS